MSFLSGYKTYITAAIGLGMAAAQVAGLMPDGVHVDPGAMVIAAVGLIFARVGAVKSGP